jgi:hypothetical protein
MTPDLFPSPVHPAQAVYDLSRNGSNGWTRHPLAKRMLYTSGIEELCEAAGAFWMLDVIGTEATPILLKQWETGAALGIIELIVEDSRATFAMTTSDDEPPIWKRSIPYTDFPPGRWVLYLACDSVIDYGVMNTVLCLPSEN